MRTPEESQWALGADAGGAEELLSNASGAAICPKVESCPFPSPPLRGVTGDASTSALAFPPSKRGRAIFITYGDGSFAKSRKRLLKEARSFGCFDEVHGFQPKDIDADYAKRNAALLKRPRGGGYWAWKSYFIYRTLLSARDGDIVFYNDAGSTFNRDPRPLLALAARYGAVTFRISFPARDWTKGVVFQALGMPMNMWGKQHMIAAGTIVLQRRPYTLELARQFMLYSQNATLISDDVVKSVPNWSGFKDHRHDQSIWTLLCYKYGVSLMLTTGTFPADEPGDIILHTRKHG